MNPAQSNNHRNAIQRLILLAMIGGWITTGLVLFFIFTKQTIYLKWLIPAFLAYDAFVIIDYMRQVKKQNTEDLKIIR